MDYDDVLRKASGDPAWTHALQRIASECEGMEIDMPKSLIAGWASHGHGPEDVLAEWDEYKSITGLARETLR